MGALAYTKIPVAFFFDEESKNWGFHVENPRVIGGGQETLEEARQAAAEAIAFALEEPLEEAEGRIEYLEVSIIHPKRSEREPQRS